MIGCCSWFFNPKWPQHFTNKKTLKVPPLITMHPLGKAIMDKVFLQQHSCHRGGFLVLCWKSLSVVSVMIRTFSVLLVSGSVDRKSIQTRSNGPSLCKWDNDATLFGKIFFYAPHTTLAILFNFWLHPRPVKPIFDQAVGLVEAKMAWVIVQWLHYCVSVLF